MSLGYLFSLARAWRCLEECRFREAAIVNRGCMRHESKATLCSIFQAEARDEEVEEKNRERGRNDEEKKSLRSSRRACGEYKPVRRVSKLFFFPPSLPLAVWLLSFVSPVPWQLYSLSYFNLLDSTSQRLLCYVAVVAPSPCISGAAVADVARCGCCSHKTRTTLQTETWIFLARGYYRPSPNSVRSKRKHPFLSFSYFISVSFFILYNPTLCVTLSLLTHNREGREKHLLRVPQVLLDFALLVHLSFCSLQRLQRGPFRETLATSCSLGAEELRSLLLSLDANAETSLPLL